MLVTFHCAEKLNFIPSKEISFKHPLQPVWLGAQKSNEVDPVTLKLMLIDVVVGEMTIGLASVCTA